MSVDVAWLKNEISLHATLLRLREDTMFSEKSKMNNDDEQRRANIPLSYWYAAQSKGKDLNQLRRRLLLSSSSSFLFEVRAKKRQRRGDNEKTAPGVNRGTAGDERSGMCWGIGDTHGSATCRWYTWMSSQGSEASKQPAH